MKRTQRVVVYGSLGLRPGLSELLWAFRKSNKLEEFPVFLDDHPFQVVQRIKAEAERGMRTADVVIVPHYVVLGMAQEGMLAPHEAEGARLYPRAYGAAGGLWHAVAVTFMSMAYNQASVKPRDLPLSLEDLSSPPFRGALGTQSLTSSRVGNLGVHYMAFLAKKAGRRRFEAFLGQLAAGNRPKAYDCIDHLIQGLLDRETKVALTVYSLAYYREKTAGAPVALLQMDDAPPMVTWTTAAMLKQAEENESARRFLDFLLTPGAQRLIGRIPGLHPALPGAKTSYNYEVRVGPRTEFHPVKGDMEAAAEAAAEFSRLGLP